MAIHSSGGLVEGGKVMRTSLSGGEASVEVAEAGLARTEPTSETEEGRNLSSTGRMPRESCEYSSGVVILESRVSLTLSISIEGEGGCWQGDEEDSRTFKRPN